MYSYGVPSHNIISSWWLLVSLLTLAVPLCPQPQHPWNTAQILVHQPCDATPPTLTLTLPKHYYCLPVCPSASTAHARQTHTARCCCSAILLCQAVYCTLPAHRIYLRPASIPNPFACCIQGEQSISSTPQCSIAISIVSRSLASCADVG